MITQSFKSGQRENPQEAWPPRNQDRNRQAWPSAQGLTSREREGEPEQEERMDEEILGFLRQAKAAAMSDPAKP